MKALRIMLVTLIVLWAGIQAAPAATLVLGDQPGGHDPVLGQSPPNELSRSNPFPGADQRVRIVDLTNNSYDPLDGFPHGYYMKYSGFNSDGTRIAVAARNTNTPATTPNEIWVMDYDAVTRTISNFQQMTSSGGTGDIYENSMPAWSRSDPDLLLYLEVHVTSANVVMTLDVATSTTAILYDPALDSNGLDATNPGFWNSSNSAIVVGSGYQTGSDKIVLFTGTYPSITISSTNQNLDPSSNYAGNRVTYYSTSATSTGSIFSENLPPWTQDNDGFGNNQPGYWSFYGGRQNDRMLSLRAGLGWSATGLGLYDANANELSDLLGDGGTDFKYVYANHNWEGPSGEVLFRAEEYAHAGYGNNLYLAVLPVLNADTGESYLTIQTAIDAAASGETIEVAPGLYTERLVIDKPLTLLGATHDVNKNGYAVPSGYAWDTDTESVIDYPDPTGQIVDQVVVDIRSDDVTFKGFIVQILNARVNADHLLRLNATIAGGEGVYLSGIAVENNVLGPVTNIGGQDGTKGRMGLYFSSPSYTAQRRGIRDTHVSGNKIFDTRGNGDAVFIWGAAESYLSPANADYTGTVIEDNEIYGSHRAGIEIAGGVSHLTIRDNEIYGNSSTNGGSSDPNLKYGSGIVVIRMGSDKTSATGMGCDDLTLEANDIHDNEKHGIYLGPIVSQFAVSHNFVRNNGWDGVQVDLTEQYYGGSWPVYDQASGIVVSENDLSANLGLSVSVIGTPTNGFLLDASGNWHGQSAPTLVAGEVGDFVDYTPWLHSPDVGDPGFQGDFSVLWVDDDSPQVGTEGRIQEGIDLADGSTVYVAAGTYREQIRIDGKSVNLSGAGIGSSIIEAVDLGDRTGYTITQWESSTRAVDACIGIVGPATVNISAFTIDGRQLGPDNFYGVHFFDADGSVTDCRIEDILDAAHPGYSRIASLVATHGVGGDFDVEFSDNVIPNMQKGGILLMGPSGVCTIERNDIDDAPDPVLAGNGIQVSYGCSGILTDNDVTGMDYTGTSWGASGILLFESDDVSVSGGTITDCEMALNHSQWNWIYTPSATPVVEVAGVEVDGGDYGVSTHLGGPGATLDLTVSGCRIQGCVYSGVDLWGSDEDPWGGDYYAGWTNGTLTALIEGCQIACGDGVTEWVDLEPNTVDVSIHDCNLGGNGDYGVYNDYDGNTIDAEQNWWGDPSGPTLVRSAGKVSVPVATPAPFLAGEMEQPAQPKAVSRLRGESAEGRSGVNVSDHVDFDPWRSGNVVCTPDPLFLTATATGGDVTVRYLGGGSGLVYGYSVKFSWVGGVVSTDTDQVTEGDLLADVAGPEGTRFYKHKSGNEITVDCVLLGDVEGALGPGDMFTVHFTGVAYGESPVNVTVVAVRDKNNQPLSGFYEDDGLIKVDLTNPAVTNAFIENVTLTHTDDWVKNGDAVKVTATVTDDGPLTIRADLTGLGGGASVAPDSYVGNVATWNLAAVTCTPADGTITVTVTATDALSNSANGSDSITSDNTEPAALAGLSALPGHKKVHLSWTDGWGADPTYEGVIIRWDGWDDYPLYAVTEPAYPGDPAAGEGTAFEGTGSSTDHTFAAHNRDIYYYGGFAYDHARNYSDPHGSGGNNARATNYWLGDVVPNNAWDGYVNTADITALGSTYYYYTNPQCDVGPTHNGSRRGIPEPDGLINFEDLMIFAMNFGVVGPMTLPPLGVPSVETTGAVALRLELPASVAPGSELAVPVYLQDARGIVQGVHFRVAYDARTLQYLGTQPGALVENCEQSFFMPLVHEGLPVVDVAALGDGATFGRSGELAVLRFRCTGEGALALRLEEISARNVLNEDLFAEGSDVVSGPEARIPVDVFLAANRPNPFQGSTGIVFGLPKVASVRLAVYDVSGRVVRTLAAGSWPAGEHTLAWDRRDDAGRAVAGGLYFYRLETEGRTITRKMIVTE